MNTIIGITIGPIVETISESKKISEIANASLFFSTIISSFLDRIDTKKYAIITPNVEISTSKEKFYPDRVVLESLTKREDNELLEEIKEIYNSIVEEKELEELKNYVNFNIVVSKLEDDKIKDIFQYLDGIELVKNFPQTFDYKAVPQKIEKYLEVRKTLRNKEYDINMGAKGNDSNSGYRAIVCLDLDKMGKFSQNNIKDIKKVSEAIYAYISKLNEFIKNKKGMVLYSAGDDVLAIINPKDIFEFIQYACNTLNSDFKEFGNDELSVSFGIMVCYAKYPIKEAIEKSQELLFGKAKTTRNTATLLVQKHSGQSAEISFYNLIDSKKRIFNENKFFKYLSQNIANEGEDNSRLLNSIVQKVSMNSFIFKNIINDNEKIKNYLSHLFDLKKEGEKQLKILEELLFEIGKFSNESNFNKNLNQVLTFFRILKFYISKGKEER